MSLRDIIITLLIVGAVPFILRRPVIGIYFWVWVSVMSPHRLTWGFAYNMPFAQVIAFFTLLGIFFTKDEKRFPMTGSVGVLLLMMVWVTVTLVTGFDVEMSLPMYERVMKIWFMVIVGLYLVQTRQHVHILTCIIAFSVAFYGIKGGLFTVRGGGDQKVWGPWGSFIQDNNSLALATIMTIPLLWYVRQRLVKPWQRMAIVGAMVLCTFSALGSQSRGALLALVAISGFFWLKSRGKLVTGLVLVLTLPFVISFMPAKWTDRMRTIQTYDEDGSALGRLNAWQMAINLTKDRPLNGGGFEIYNFKVFGKYAPNPADLHSAHSIYFQMLGEHGYVGLLLFILLWILVYRDASWIIKQVSGREDWRWASDLAKMIQVSLVGYATGGAFLNLAYYDVPYNMLLLIVATRMLVQREIKEVATGWRTGPNPVPRPAAAAPLGGARAPGFKPQLSAERSLPKPTA